MSGANGSNGVSVIIPTTGRPELARAVRSALAQEDAGTIEVIIVDDSGSGASQLACEDSGAVVLHTAGRQGSSFARNLGIRAATQPWVAYLDDDDAFLPGKLQSQLRVGAKTMADTRMRPIISSQVEQVSGERRVGPIPAEVYDGGEVSTYLFRRRRPGAGRASAYTSTLLCPRDIALEVPWDEDLSRHTDWDWLIRATSRSDTVLVQIAEVQVEIYPNSSGSISARSDWETSLEWGTKEILPKSRQVYADFVAAQPLRYATLSRSLAGVIQCFAHLWIARRFPAWGPLMIGASGVLSRKALEKLMMRLR